MTLVQGTITSCLGYFSETRALQTIFNLAARVIILKPRLHPVNLLLPSSLPQATQALYHLASQYLCDLTLYYFFFSVFLFLFQVIVFQVKWPLATSCNLLGLFPTQGPGLFSPPGDISRYLFLQIFAATSFIFTKLLFKCRFLSGAYTACPI